MSEPKEPNYFSDDAAYALGLDAYAALFANASPEQIVGESSTHYTKLPTFESVAARIAKHTPEAKFIYVMRDPLARLVSQYVHEWSMREVVGSLDEAVRQHERFIAYSCYHRQLMPYLQEFGSARILPVFFERMIAEPVRELERVARFVGDEMSEPAIWHEDVAQQNAGMERMRKSGVREFLTNSPLGGFLKASLPSGAKESVKSLWRMRSRPSLSPAVEALARRALDDDLARLGPLLGLELDCDGFKAVAPEVEPGWA